MPKPPGAFGVSDDGFIKNLQTAMDNLHKDGFNDGRPDHPANRGRHVTETRPTVTVKPDPKKQNDVQQIGLPTEAVHPPKNESMQWTDFPDAAITPDGNRPTFTQEDKGELISIVISNKMDIISVTDEEIVFAHKGKKYKFMAVRA